jgi:RHS repeat-associated protein
MGISSHPPREFSLTSAGTKSPGQVITTYNYDTESNLLSIEDANGNTTSFGYDAYGRVIQTTFPSTHYEQYGYDAANHLTSKTDRNGQTIGYVYDDLYRMTQKNYPNSTSVEYVYDLVGKLQQVTDPTGTYGFAYDNMGRLVGTTTQYTFVTATYTNAYTYDADSNRVSMTDPQGGTTSYVYDTLNRLSTLTQPTAFGSGSFGFTYDALSRRTQMTRPNGVTTNYSYNSLSQLLSVLHQIGTSTIDGATYTVDPAGNRTAKTDMYANVTSNYTYDPLYELTQVTQATNTTESYTYDPVGNRLSSLGVSPYSVNSSNELTSTPSATYTYDNNGNALTKATSAGTTTYGWDYENRLVSITLPGTGGTLAFKYDGFGRRVQKVFTQNSTSTITNYLYDGSNSVEDVDQNGNLLARYIMTQNIDEPLAELRSSTTSYFSQDGVGSVTSLTTSAGGVGNTYRYDSFGNLTASSGSTVNRFQYTGREFDSETGLYFYRARYHDASTGRFLSEDPMGFEASFNFYPYTLNRPTNFRDPDGMDIAVIENGPTNGNPLGHTAIAISGQGVYSFGNNTKCGSSLADYLHREAPRRNTVIYIIRTTPAQDAAALADLRAQGGCERTLPKIYGNCSSIANSALTAAGIPRLPEFNPINGEPLLSGDFIPGTAGLRAAGAGANSINIPKNSPTLPGGLQGFEPPH